MKTKYVHKNAHLSIKWKCDLDRSVIEDNCEERGWERVEDPDDPNWNFYWASIAMIRQIFNPRFKMRLNDNQLINHFPNHMELTRKDLLVKNIKRLRSEGEFITMANGRKIELKPDVIPPSYILPQEYSLFIEEFSKTQHKKWIFKPASKSQGKGISLITKPSQAKNVPNMMSEFKTQSGCYNETFIVSKYLDNPLLLAEKKFDLRLYVCVTNYRPLKVYKYLEGFCRLCFENYTSINGKQDPNEELFAHLTNVSLQKYCSQYNDVHGGKWPFTSFLQFIEVNYGRERMTKLVEDIDRIFLIALKAVQPVILNDKHCFELYGFDVLIDDTFVSWLIEVNASPSLVTTTRHDKILKKNLMNDLINLLIPSQWTEGKRGKGSSSCKEKKVGKFVLLYDESEDPFSKQMDKAKKLLKRPNSNYVNFK